MKVSRLVFLVLCLTGCTNEVGSIGINPKQGFQVVSNPVMRQGEALKLIPPEDGKLVVTFTNLEAGSTTRVEEPLIRGQAAFSLKLDPSVIPGYDAGKDFYEIKADIDFTPPGPPPPFGPYGPDMEFVLVRDPDVKALPNSPYQIAGNRPPGQFVPTPSATNDEAKALVDVILAEFQLTTPEIAISPVDPSAAPTTPYPTIHTEPVPMLTFRVKGNFQRYFIPASVAASGKSHVVKPAELEIVVTKADPSSLVSLKVKD